MAVSVQLRRLGDRIRFVRIATGDYKNSSIAVHGAAR